YYFGCSVVEISNVSALLWLKRKSQFLLTRLTRRSFRRFLILWNTFRCDRDILPICERFGFTITTYTSLLRHLLYFGGTAWMGYWWIHYIARVMALVNIPISEILILPTMGIFIYFPEQKK